MVSQGCAFHVLHHDERLAMVRTAMDHFDDIGVGKPLPQLEFSLEPIQIFLVHHNLFFGDLDGNCFTEPIGAAVHPGHGALADHSGDREGAGQRFVREFQGSNGFGRSSNSLLHLKKKDVAAHADASSGRERNQDARDDPALVQRCTIAAALVQEKGLPLAEDDAGMQAGDGWVVQDDVIAWGAPQVDQAGCQAKAPASHWPADTGQVEGGAASGSWWKLPEFIERPRNLPLLLAEEEIKEDPSTQEENQDQDDRRTAHRDLLGRPILSIRS